MIRWFLRGASRGRLTTKYPRGEERPPPGFRGRALLDPTALDRDQAARCVAACLPGALSLDDRGRITLDGGRCIGCGLCVEASGGQGVTLDSSYELAVDSRQRLGGQTTEEPAARGGYWRDRFGDRSTSGTWIRVPTARSSTSCWRC